METIKGNKRKYEAKLNFKDLDIIIGYNNIDDSDLVRRILAAALKEMDTNKKNQNGEGINIPTFIRDCKSKSLDDSRR